MQNQQPNLLILCSDELRADCLGYAGNPDIRTPNIDALAARSVDFSQHCATFPKCVPSRVSLMTGRYTHTDGYRTITEHMRHDQANLLASMKERGYETAVFGKNHCWSEETYKGGGIDHISWSGQWNDLANEVKATAPTCPAPKRPSLELEAGFDYKGCERSHLNDDVYTAQAERFLTSARDRNRPFFLQVNIESPHPNYAVEEPWFSLYDPEKIQAFPHQLPKNAPLPLIKQREIRTGNEPNTRAFRELQATYYGMIAKVDEQCGKILAALDAAGDRDNTIVLFWSDHGDFAGQYGLPEKWDTTFSDCLIRTPCLLSGPGVPEAQKTETLSDHSDLAPTLCSLLGFDPLPGMHGHNLLPILAGDAPARSATFADGGHEDAMLERFNFDPAIDAPWRTNNDERFAKQDVYEQAPDSMARAKMARTRDYKLVMRLRGGNELYDLRSDPWELENRFGDPALSEIQATLMEELVNWSLRTDSDQPFQPKVGA